jgi:PAS domain S-box-containing protein
MKKKKSQLGEAAELRHRAEAQLKAKTPDAGFSRTDDETQRLLHELQVHQIELEMQNAELRQARDEAETAMEKYADLYDFAPAGYFTLDREGIIRSVNLTGASLVGVERSRLLGRRFAQFVAATDRPALTAFLGKSCTSPAKEMCEATLLNEGNSPLFVQIEAVASASGQECRIALLDITARKRTEEALRESEERYRLLIDGVKDYAIIMLDGDGRVISWNEGARRLKGWDAQEILGRHFSLFYTEDAVAAGHPEHELGIATAEGRYVEEGWRVRKDGSKFVADVIITAIRDEFGKLRGFAKITRDITERKKAEESLRQAKEEAEAAARSKSQFLINMSHELRTPMTGILGMLQFALEEDLAPAPREYLETTLTSARALLSVLNDILIMAKIEAGKLTIEEKPFSPQRCITEAVDLIAPEVRRKGLDFVISVAEEVPETAVGDQVRLRQILTNLIGNAVKFTEGGKVDVRVTAGRATSDGKREFTFAVTDTGIGIPDDKKELLFRAFSQVDASLSRRYGGTGLGLAISREIVELMGGTIGFESAEGVGSTFSCTIPLGDAGLESDAQPAAEPQSTETITPAPVGERIPCILIAEDDPTTREVMGLMLKRSNYNIDFAENGLKAVKLWEKGGYDLVLMDVHMPRLNGFEATRTIREKELERGGHTPIVAVTAHALKVDEERCLAAGMDAYVSKPIDFKKCVEVMRELLRLID